ncbi:MAG: hypothetical protein KGJ86_20775, partial [Chloroflexota bacterium]|nr:hypothetical protein [Chloroflexota bacterium]
MKLRLRLLRPRRRRGPIGESKAWAGLLMAWMAVTLSATNYLDPGPTRMLPPALQGATTTIGLWRPFPYAGSLFAIFGSLLYLAAGVFSRFGLAGFEATDLPLSQQLLAAAPGLVTVFLALQGTGWLADTLATRTERDEVQRRSDRRLIEDLVPTHGETGIMKWAYAERTVQDEVTRARRYGSPLTFALLGPRDSRQDGNAEIDFDSLAAEQLALAELTRQALRPTDLIALYRTGDLAVVMPETTVHGALIALDKVRAGAEKELGPLSIGIAEFPDDGADTEELVTEAEHAIQFARESQLGVVSRTLLA